MGSFSIWHWLIVLVVLLLLFGGGGKIPRIMGDLAKGIRSFKNGLKEEDDQPTSAEPKTIEAQAEPGDSAGDAAPARKDSETV